MGNLNCSNCKASEDIFNEIKSDSSSLNNPSFHKEQIASSDLSQTNINKPQEFRNPYMDYSYALFQRFNLIRTEPLKFYSESDKYNLSNIIEELIDKNVVFLMTGNSLEIFGKYIENEDKTRIEGLSLFDIYTKRDLLNRHSSIFVGKYEDIELVGFKSQFAFSFGDNSKMYFTEAEKGIGLNPNTKLEGIKKNNFIGT